MLKKVEIVLAILYDFWGLDFIPIGVHLEDMNMDESYDELAVQLAAQGVTGKRVDEMEAGFMMALDYMIQLANNDEDEKRKALLEVIKETVLSHLTKKCPPHIKAFFVEHPRRKVDKNYSVELLQVAEYFRVSMEQKFIFLHQI